MDKPLPISGPSLLCPQNNGERAACLFCPYIPTVGDWVIFTRLRSHTDELCPPRIIPFNTIIRPQDTARPADSHTHSRLSHCPTHHRRSQSAEFLLCGQDTPPAPRFSLAFRLCHPTQRLQVTQGAVLPAPASSGPLTHRLHVPVRNTSGRPPVHHRSSVSWIPLRILEKA